MTPTLPHDPAPASKAPAWKRAIPYCIAPALSLALFWRAIFTWFLRDDFVWLGLRLQVRDASSLAHALFTPAAQGTVRVLSERVYFLALSSIFGLWSAPFRAAAFAIWFVALTLSAWIGERLTGSKAAGIWAAVLWASCHALMSPLAWTSAFNELLCACLLLLAFHSRLRGAAALEWVAYLLAFGAKETAALYPLVVVAYELWLRPVPEGGGSPPRKGAAAPWLFVPAICFGALHLFFIPRLADETYRLTIDSRLPETLYTYTRWALSPDGLADIVGARWSMEGMIAAMTGACLVAFAIRRVLFAMFCGAWFLIFLGPALALPNHRTEYYLTLPAVGLAWLGGWAVTVAWKRAGLVRAAAVIVVIVFLAGQATAIRFGTAAILRQTSHMRVAVRAAEEVERRSPHTALIFHGVDTELFQAGFQEKAFAVVGAPAAYLTPDTQVVGRADLSQDEFRLTPNRALALLQEGKTRALDVSNPTAYDVTEPYRVVMRALVAAEGASVVNVGSPDDADKLGPGWYSVENGFRWTGKTARVTLSARHGSGKRLYVTGYAPDPVVVQGPLTLVFAAGAERVGEAAISKAGAFSADFALPAKLAGQPSIPLDIQASRVLRPPGEPRELGVIFGTFEIR